MGLGYCCINLELQTSKGITVNRSMKKRTFQEKGLEYASELALQNIRDLIEIIKWNERNGIKLYRMSSDMFPWMSEYEFSDLPNFDKISNLLKGAGTLALSYGQRLTFHPGPFNVLASPNEAVVQGALRDLQQHGQIMDLMGLPRSPYSAINIHIGGTYGDKDATMARFCENFKRLSPEASSRLVVENDDKPSMYSTLDLYFGVHQKIGIPITFDYLHHSLQTGGLSEQRALILAAITWRRNGVKQLTHYSSSKKLNEDNTSIIRAHADFIYEQINTYGLDIDIELEAKAKDRALFQYMKQFECELV